MAQATATATFATAACAVCVPPMRAMFDIPLKTDPNKKFHVEWELAMPNVTFFYNEEKDGKFESFTSQFECNDLYEKFGLKKSNNDLENANNLGDALTKYFTDNLVTLEVLETKNYAMEFRKKDDGKAFFQACLKKE